MSRHFPDDPVQGDRAFSFLGGGCVVLPSTVLVYIVPSVGFVFMAASGSLWWMAPALVTVSLGLWHAKETWRRAIALIAFACLFLGTTGLWVWLAAFGLTSAIDGWRVHRRRNRFFGLE